MCAGAPVQVKIGVAAGEVNMLFVGSNEARSYMEMGRGIEAVNKAENLCENGGDIVVSPTAWIHCTSLKGEYQVMADGKHVKVGCQSSPDFLTNGL
jgi:class 3 adenylate cyclase